MEIESRIYLCAVIDGKYIAESYAGKLGKVSVGKSCIRFKKYEDLDQGTLIEVLKELNLHYSSGKPLFG